MLEPLEIMGLNSFGDSAVIVRARLKTKPLTQWATGREYNRRLKAAFDERGIEIPFPPYANLLRRGQAGPRARRPGGDRRRASGRGRASRRLFQRRGGAGESGQAARAHAARAKAGDGPEDAGNSSGEDAPG